MEYKALNLNAKQLKAFKQLEEAFSKCGKLGIDIHGEMTTLYAVKKDAAVTVGESSEVSDFAESIRPDCFCGCFADDGVGLLNP